MSLLRTWDSQSSVLILIIIHRPPQEGVSWFLHAAAPRVVSLCKCVGAESAALPQQPFDVMSEQPTSSAPPPETPATSATGGGDQDGGGQGEGGLSKKAAKKVREGDGTRGTTTRRMI